MITGAIFENLVEYDQDGVLKPQLAKALPEISADKLIYTFDLRDDVQFHNGQQMTAEDVKYSFEFDAGPEARRRPPRRLFAHRPAGDRYAHARQDLPEGTLHPLGLFPDEIHGHLAEGSARELWRRPFQADFLDGVGTGPGMFEEWRPNEYVSLKRNPNYWQKELPRWERLVVRIVPEDATRVAYLMTGETDIIGAPPPRDFARLKTQRGITGEAKATLGGWSVFMMNTQRPPFDDVNFRKAIAYCIDRNSIARDVFSRASFIRRPCRRRPTAGGTTKRPTGS